MDKNNDKHAADHFFEKVFNDNYVVIKNAKKTQLKNKKSHNYSFIISLLFLGLVFNFI